LQRSRTPAPFNSIEQKQRHFTAVFFHSHLADQNQMIHFFKNFAILGGLLQVVAFGE
jgi:hypothetical protein